MRLTWVQPEDLVPHALVQAAVDGVDAAGVADRWRAAGGPLTPAVSGASDDPALVPLRGLAGALLDEIDRLTDERWAGEECDELDVLASAWTPPPVRPAAVDGDRMLGAWLGRAAGCLLGKPVEKLPREGIRAIAEATGNWPVRGYFTEIGLPAEIGARWTWNKRSRPTSLVENIDGMPEDDDLNFAMLALALVERHGAELTTEDVAQAWLSDLPAGRVFTAERAAYRNLLNGVPPERAALVRNPFREWIGALIRADVYGWTSPGDPHAAARAAYPDAWLSHRRNGLYGALFVAAASSAALLADDVETVLDAGLSVVPADSSLDRALRHGRELGRSGRPLDEALDELHANYGDLHWVHTVNNAALIAYALTASDGDFATAAGIAVMGGWDTDSAGATVGALCGALAGAAALPQSFVAPLKNRIASSLPGFDGIAIDELAARTSAAVQVTQ
jgi:ADP-ribosylglycohydrolase